MNRISEAMSLLNQIRSELAQIREILTKLTADRIGAD